MSRLSPQNGQSVSFIRTNCRQPRQSRNGGGTRPDSPMTSPVTRDAARHARRGGFENDLELAMVEGFAARILDLHEPLAQPVAVHLACPMIAHRVVAGTAHQGVRRPG